MKGDMNIFHIISEKSNEITQSLEKPNLWREETLHFAPHAVHGVLWIILMM